MEHDFYDQVILVTGGTGALGSKVAELFLKFSPKAIIISYRSEKEMQELKHLRLNTVIHPIKDLTAQSTVRGPAYYKDVIIQTHRPIRTMAVEE